MTAQQTTVSFAAWNAMAAVGGPLRLWVVTMKPTTAASTWSRRDQPAFSQPGRQPSGSADRT